VIRKLKPDSAKKTTVTEPLAAGEARVAEEAEVEHRLCGGALADDEGGEQPRCECEAREAAGAAPAVVGSLDDRVGQQRHRRAREHQSRAVGLVRARVARGGHAPGDEHGADNGDGRHRVEDARPAELLEQPAPDDRAERDCDPRRRAPKADRAGALGPLGEHVRDQREGGGEHHRGAETHEAAGDDQLARGRGQSAGNAGDSEHAQPGQQKAFAAEAVAETAGGQQQRSEHEVVGIDDPLQLRVRRMQLANQRREGHVDDRDVEVDHKRCQQQRDENQRAASHDWRP